MDIEIKECPFCGKEPMCAGQLSMIFVSCVTEDCPLFEVEGITLQKWQERRAYEWANDEEEIPITEAQVMRSMLNEFDSIFEEDNRDAFNAALRQFNERIQADLRMVFGDPGAPAPRGIIGDPERESITGKPRRKSGPRKAGAY